MEDAAGAVEVRKRELRRSIRARMSTLAPARRALEEEVVQAAVQAEAAWQDARTVLLYKAVPPELSVVGLANAAWRMGKRTLFPRVSGPGALELREVASWSELATGAFGVPEPAATAPLALPHEVDLAIVPGVGWDASGHRLGRGGGYYDRLLPHLRLSWGVGFDCQWVSALPLAPWDAAVHRTWIPTPSHLLEPAST